MSYRPFRGGPHLSCWLEPESICVRELDGSVNKYTCRTNVTSDEQLNLFSGINVAWAVKIDDTLYVGRYDSTWSAFMPSGLLVAYGGWYMPRRKGIEIGQMRAFPALLDSANLRYVSVFAAREIYELIAPWPFPEVDIPRSYTDAWKGSPNLHIYVPGGEFDVHRGGTWISPPLARRPYTVLRL